MKKIFFPGYCDVELAKIAEFSAWPKIHNTQSLIDHIWKDLLMKAIQYVLNQFNTKCIVGNN